MILTLSLVLVALLVAVIWILPGMLDWTRYRSSIEALVAAGVGRPVEIQGNISLHLLPQPVLTASDLRLGNSGDSTTMTVHEVRLRVALGPLLAGRVDARELVLRGADLRLPWPPPPEALTRRPPPWLTGLQARAEESRLQVGNLVLEDIDASLGSDADTGTLSAAGSGKALGQTWHFTARLGRPGRDGAAPLDVSLDGQNRLRDTGGTFSGSVTEAGGLSGRVAARGPDLSQIMPAPAIAWRGDGRLSASGGLALADELALEIGGSPARGAIALRVDPDLRLDLAVAAGRLDLDAWVPALLRTVQAEKPSLPIGIDVSAEAASLAGGTLRQVRLALDLDPAEISVREASALLPGDATTAIQGRFPRAGRPTQFQGLLKLTAPDLRTTLRWLQPLARGFATTVPEGVPRTADIAAKLAFDTSQVSLTEIKGTVENGAIEGGIALRWGGARPSLSTGLTLERMLLDPWLPTIDPDPARAFAALQSGLAAAKFDLDLKLQVRHAALGATAWAPLSLDAQTEAGRLTVRRLEASGDGVHLAASGVVGDGGRISEGRIEATAQDAATQAARLPASLAPLSRLMTGPATMLVLLSGPSDALAIRATLDLSDLRLEAQPTVNLAGRRLSGSIALHHPGAPRLLERLGLRDPAAWLGDGSFSVIAQVAAQRDRIDLPTVEVIAGTFRGTGQLTLAKGVVVGRLHAEELPLPALNPRSANPLPAELLRSGTLALHVDADEVAFALAPFAKDVAADIAVTNGSLSITVPKAKLGGGTLAGSLRLTQGDNRALSLAAEIADIALTGPLTGAGIDLTGGILHARATLEASGSSPITLLATLAGDGSVEVRDAIVTGFDLSAAEAAFAAADPTALLAQLRTALAAGTTRLPELSIPFSIRRGVVTVHAKGTAEAAQAALEASYDVLGRAIDGRLTVHPGGDRPDASEVLTGPMAHPVLTPELAAASRWLAERP